MNKERTPGSFSSWRTITSQVRTSTHSSCWRSWPWCVWTGTALLEDHNILFFCNNTASMSASMHGYARSPHMGALSNTIHLALASLRCNPWFDWVPTDANCADIPSRPQGPAEHEFCRTMNLKPWLVGMRLPSIQRLHATFRRHTKINAVMSAAPQKLRRRVVFGVPGLEARIMPVRP